MSDELAPDDAELLGDLPEWTGFEVTEPGRYVMPDPIYHADPVPDPGSLSSTGAKAILKTPALFAHLRQFGLGPKRAFDQGSAAHALVLGTGPELVVIENTGPAGGKTKADKVREAEARARGAIPLSQDDYDMVHNMADALRANTEVAELLSHGTAEEAFFAVDPATKMWIRGKTDYRHEDQMFLDYKTSSKPVDVDSFSRTMAAFGYNTQGAFYKHLLMVLGLITSRSDFLIVAQEKSPPYLCAVLRPDKEAMAYGYAEAMLAIETFQRCVFSGEWPGYPSQPQEAGLPGWKLRDYETRGIEPVYIDHHREVMERIRDADSRKELQGLSLVFPLEWQAEDVRAYANLRWTQLGKAA